MNVSIYNETSPEDEADEIADIINIAAVVVPIFFGLITITGIFGNGLVVTVVCFNPQMKTTTNLLIGNLAVADLLFVIFCIPFTASDYMFALWPYGLVWCKIVQYLIVVTAHASIYTLVLMSLDRFLAVVHPIASRSVRTDFHTKIAIAILWSVILVTSIPVAVWHGLKNYEIDGIEWLSCTLLLYNPNEKAAFHIIFITTSYILPLILISGLYLRMITRLWRTVVGSNMSAESHRGRKRVTRLVVVVVVAFASLWFPIQIILLLKGLGQYHTDTKFTVLMQIFSHTIAYTTSCINPLLYAFLSDNFRKAFHKAINCSGGHEKRYFGGTWHQVPSRASRPSAISCSTTAM